MITALVGAQYGSEGKGLIAAHLAYDYDVHVRTGAPNAGHTFYHPDTGEKWVMQQIPCGWINPRADLVIGPGAVVDLDQLEMEARLIEAHGYQVRSRLAIDRKATVLDWRHNEGGVTGKAHELIGSTGKGVGLARMARINRGALVHASSVWSHCKLVADHEEGLTQAGFIVCDTLTRLAAWADIGSAILLEGTQGSGLSLTHGPWPHVTSADTNAAQLCADAGVSPRMLTDVILVARTYPIRVAGNSGPLHAETTFKEIGVEPEFTTVTKKMRRIGRWDSKIIARAIALNRPCRIALTFLDYVFPEDAGKTTRDSLSAEGLEWVYSLERSLPHFPVISYVGTGPKTVVNMDRR